MNVTTHPPGISRAEGHGNTSGMSRQGKRFIGFGAKASVRKGYGWTD
jgi:hypothetical protein